MCSAPITVSTLSCLKKAKFPMYIKLLWNMECTSYSFCPVLPEWGRIFLHIESVIECRHTAGWPLAANLTRAPVHRRKDLQCLTTGQQPNWNILYTHTKKHRHTLALDYFFKHLRLYIRKHFGQSVAVCGIPWKGRSWQTKVHCTARYSRVQSGKARYSQVQPDI